MNRIKYKIPQEHRENSILEKRIEYLIFEINRTYENE
jgi:hypothetical protein